MQQIQKLPNQTYCVGKSYLETTMDSIKSEDTKERIGTSEESDKVRQDSHLYVDKKEDSRRTRPLIPMLLMSSPSKTSLKCRSSSLSRNINTVTAAKVEKISSSQKQYEQLQDHHLEQQESESDTTHMYLETELQHAQELKKLAGKLHRTRNNHIALQRINQDLKNKLHRMAQLHEKEKSNLNHEVNILSNHLMEAKVTIEKLTGNNVPAEIQESLGEYTEKFGHGLRGTVCVSPFSETQAHMLEYSEPICLPGSPIPVSPSRQATHGFMKNTDKLDQGSQFKANLFCSDTALYCPAEQRRGRSKVRDMQGRSAGFFRSQSFTDSFMEVEDFSTSPLSEPPPNYSPSVSNFSNYLSCTRTAKKKGTVQTTIKPTHHIQCFDMRDDICERKCSTSQEHRNNKSSPVHAGPLHFKDMTCDGMQCSYATLPAHFNDSLHLSRISIQQERAPKLYNDQKDMHESENNTMGQYRKVNMHNLYRAPRKISSSSCTEQQPDNSLMKRTTNQVNQLFSTSREDNFFDGQDPDLNNFMDSNFRAISENDYNDVQKQETFSMSKQKDTEKDPKTLLSEKDTNQTCIKHANTFANIRNYVDVAPLISTDFSYQQPITLFVVHNIPLDNGVLKSKEKSSKINGLYRKDSLTKAQLYGNLLN